MGWYGYGFRPYVSVASRRANAAREMAKLQKKGRIVTPIKIAGRKIVQTFWGEAWCNNMENYSDYANRLPRGRTYVRNGSVLDLQIAAGKVTAMVAGSELYEIDIQIQPCAKKRWNEIRSQCAGKIGSLIELLQGKLSGGVMQIITGAESGLFPKPNEIKLNCSCPDGAYMCKHLAAVLYGVGARLDLQPELLFTLREVDHLELIAQAGDVQKLVDSASASGQKTLGANELADVFEIELEPGPPSSKRKPSASQPRVPKKASGKTIPARRPRTPSALVENPPVKNRKVSVKIAPRRSRSANAPETATGR